MTTEPKPTAAGINAEIEQVLKPELTDLKNTLSETKASVVKLSTEMEQTMKTVNRLPDDLKGLSEFNAGSTVTMKNLSDKMDKVKEDVESLVRNPIIAGLRGGWVQLVVLVIAMFGSAMWVRSSIDGHEDRLGKVEKSMEKFAAALVKQGEGFAQDTEKLRKGIEESTAVAKKMTESIEKQTQAVASLKLTVPGMRVESVRVGLFKGAIDKEKTALVYTFPLPKVVPADKVAGSKVTAHFTPASPPVDFPEIILQLDGELSKDGKSLSLYLRMLGMKPEEFRPARSIPVDVTIAIPE